MKRKQTTKSIQRRRRYGRLRKLKAAALSLGLATAWGGAADAATLFNATATATITLSDSAAVASCSTATATIIIEGINNVSGGSSASGSSTIPQDFHLGDESGYYYVGKSGDDLVLSFPNGGAGIIGEFWGALFLQNGQGVTEGQILDQLKMSPLENGVLLDPTSPLGMLNEQYGDLLRTPYGEESTLVAFQFIDSGNPNNGVAAGTFTMTVVPEPASWAILATAAGVCCVGVRRRE